jgi:uncharacterized protein YidB (DUF937 family)
MTRSLEKYERYRCGSRELAEHARPRARIEYSRTRGDTHMGMFDGLVGGIVGAGMVTVVNGIIEKHGGLQGVISQFQQHGLGSTVQSWVSTGPNHPISPDDLSRVLGPDLLQQLAAKSGMSQQELAQKLTQILPQAVDTMTPNGSIPAAQ